MATQIRTIAPPVISQRDLDVIVEPGCHSASIRQADLGSIRTLSLCLDGRELQ